MVDFVSVALDIIGAAQVIKDTIDEVKGFKTRSRRLGNRIHCLLPAVQLLAEMKDRKDELTSVLKESFGDDIKLFGSALEELKRCIEEAKAFIESLHKMDALTKAWRKKDINGQFDWFGDHLNELQGTIQFGILVEMREVLYGHAAKEEIRRQMEMIKEESRRLFERRREHDLEDELQDQMESPSLLETMANTASEIMKMSDSLQEASCGAKQFKSRCHRLSNAIQCIMPSMLILTDTQTRKCELSAIRMQDSDLELKVIAQSLGQLKDCVQGARFFLEPFRHMDIITKTFNKGLLKRQFCMFSERLDVLQKIWIMICWLRLSRDLGKETL
ncbi:uncharacterized protein [Amphiura filiformis]|uniref:uncharacterized protein n=1 Tax=Amphiura filiformis TaxID=82378 RepID=UPI003B213D4A